MVARELVALHLEHVLGVAQVRQEVCGDVVLRLHRAGERRRPGLEQRVLLVPGVEGDGAVVGVDRGLDRVAHVVDLVGRQGAQPGLVLQGVVGHPLERLALRAGEPVGGRVAVDHPEDPAVDDGRVDVVVEGQPRRDLLHPLGGLAVVDHLGVGVDPSREQEVRAAELDRVEQLAERRADRHAALPVVRRGAGAALAAEVELDVRRAGRAADRPRSSRGCSRRSRSGTCTSPTACSRSSCPDWLPWAHWVLSASLVPLPPSGLSRSSRWLA